LSDHSGSYSISPRLGTRRFRRNARLTVANEMFTATDRKGASSSAPLDDSPTAIEMITLREIPGTKLTEMAFVDRQGRALAITHVGDWDTIEGIELADAAGLRTFQRQPDDVPPRRPDTRDVVDSSWWKYTPSVAPLGGAAGMFSMVVEPLRWFGFLVLIAVFSYSMAALFSGAFAKHRRGPAWAAEQAYNNGDQHAFDAYYEERRRRLEASGRADLLRGEPEAGPA
jgi:hypothetical protein